MNTIIKILLNLIVCLLSMSANSALLALADINFNQVGVFTPINSISIDVCGRLNAGSSFPPCEATLFGDYYLTNINVGEILIANENTEEEFTQFANLLTNGQLDEILIAGMFNPSGGGGGSFYTETNLFFDGEKIDFSGNAISSIELTINALDINIGSFGVYRPDWNVTLAVYGTPVPIPPSLLLFISGLAGLLILKKHN